MTPSRLRPRTAALAVALLAATACIHHGQDPNDDDSPPREPVKVHVRNENFLDVNVYAVVSGVNRRLGMVSGNGSGEFTIEWNLTVGQSITINAVPIGGRGSATTGPLSIGLGQMIDFIVAPVLRQSTVSVHEPPDGG